MAFDPLSAAFEVGGKLIDRLWPDPQQRDAAKLELLKMQQTGELALLTADTQIAVKQAEINIEEAKSGNAFTSNWRPFVGWVCGFGFAFNFIVAPTLIMLADAFDMVIHMPELDVGELSMMLFGMLGLGGLRSFDKVKGTTRDTKD